MTFIVEYIWLDGENKTRSKTRVLKNINDIPYWNYDGSSTGQVGSDGDTEIILNPIVLYKDPFFRDDRHYLVWCNSTKRNDATKIFNKMLEEEPWFGLEQEYFIFSKNFDMSHINTEQGKYYCGVGYGGKNIKIGNRTAVERIIANEHLDSCLYAGLTMSGLNAEVACGQWEYQVGPCIGISAGDELHVSRYILFRIAEIYECIISFSPKINSKINGSGCHTNFSTAKTRNNRGLKVILEEYIPNLAKTHVDDVLMMGRGNEHRLTGKHETSSMNEFTWGIGTRNTSIRVGNETNINGCGYFEDRRPAANMEPYTVTSLIFERCCINI